MCGRNRFSISYVEMGFIENICPTMKFIVCFTIAMLQLIEDILDRTRPLLKYFKKISIGSRSLRMQDSLLCHTIDAKVQGMFPRGMRCLKVGFLR